MGRKVQVTALNATTTDVMNTIRNEASYEYQQMIPRVDTQHAAVQVGDILLGYPNLANQFYNALINRIALTQVKSFTYHNALERYKQGEVPFGETVEEVYTGMIKARAFNSEKAFEKEFAQYLPEIRSAFHAINFQAQYPVTTSIQKLRTAFMTEDGIMNLVNRIVDSLVSSSEYDDRLLTEYILKSQIGKGKIKTVEVEGDIKQFVKKLKSYFSRLQINPNLGCNQAGVPMTSAKEDLSLFIDCDFDAEMDVDVLASAFHMEKTEFTGRREIIDEWGTFDNERFSDFMVESNQFVPLTEGELEKCANVQAVLLDKDWFQIYDNLSTFTEANVSSVLAQNHFYTVFKTFSYSPFHNAVAFVKKPNTMLTVPDTLTAKIVAKNTGKTATTLTVGIPEVDDANNFKNTNHEFIQDEQATQNFVGVKPYGVYMVDEGHSTDSVTPKVKFEDGSTYTATAPITSATESGAQITLKKDGVMAATEENKGV